MNHLGLGTSALERVCCPHSRICWLLVRLCGRIAFCSQVRSFTEIQSSSEEMASLEISTHGNRRRTWFAIQALRYLNALICPLGLVFPWPGGENAEYVAFHEIAPAPQTRDFPTTVDLFIEKLYSSMRVSFGNFLAGFLCYPHVRSSHLTPRGCTGWRQFAHFGAAENMLGYDVWVAESGATADHGHKSI